METKSALEYRNDGSAIFRINPKIYPIDVVQSAAYILLDKAFIILDGDPEKEIIADIRAKKDVLDDVVREFNEELLNYSVYKTQNTMNKDLREAILKRVLLTNEFLKWGKGIMEKKQDETSKTQ